MEQHLQVSHYIQQCYWFWDVFWTGMFQSLGCTPLKEQPQSSSGEYYFYDFQENYLMVPASNGSSGWSPPDQLPTSPVSNLMSFNTSDHHTLPVVESLLGNQLQGDWSPQTKSPSAEWDPPSLSQMPTYYCGNNQGTLLQLSTHSSCDTGTSDDGHGWTPPTQVPGLMPPRVPTLQPQTPTPHHKHAGRTPPFHCSSNSSSDTDTLKDSEGWTPHLNPPSDIFYQASTMLSHPTASPMSVSPIISKPTICLKWLTVTYCDLSVWFQTLKSDKSDKSGQTFSMMMSGIRHSKHSDIQSLQSLQSPSQSDIQSPSQSSQSDPQPVKSAKSANSVKPVKPVRSSVSQVSQVTQVSQASQIFVEN